MVRHDSYRLLGVKGLSTHEKVNLFQNFAGPVPVKRGTYPIRGRRRSVAYLNSSYYYVGIRGEAAFVSANELGVWLVWHASGIPRFVQVLQAGEAKHAFT